MRSEPKPRRDPGAITSGISGRRSRRRNVGIGAKRKGAAALRPTTAPKPAVSEDEYLRCDLEFEDAPATQKQKNALRRINIAFLRESFVYQNPGLTAEVAGAALGLGKSQGAEILKRVREDDGTPVSRLVLAIICGMLDGSIAGVKGTPATEENRLLLRHVATFSLTAHVGLLPGWLKTRTHKADAHDALRMLLAAFRCEFENWMETSECD